MSTDTEMAERVAHLVVTASDGTVSQQDLVGGHARLADLGLTSLSYLRLIDAVENDFGVYIDLEEAEGKIGTVWEIVHYVAAQGGTYAR